MIAFARCTAYPIGNGDIFNIMILTMMKQLAGSTTNPDGALGVDLGPS